MVEAAPVNTATLAVGESLPEVYPSALGLDATMWVALAMLVVVAIAIWKKVPAMIAGTLDKRIADIRVQLDSATTLRAEAEALKTEYEEKAAAATATAEEIRTQAQTEATAILEKAEFDAAALILRRQKMAEDKIAAAERSAIADVRMRAATAAATAAASLIAEQHDSRADKSLVDDAISRLN